MLKKGSKFMVMCGEHAGKTGVVYEIDTEAYPEIIAILDADRRRECSMRYTYFRIRDVNEV